MLAVGREASSSIVWGGAAATLFALAAALAPWRLLAELTMGREAPRSLVWMVVAGLAVTWTSYAASVGFLGPMVAWPLAAAGGVLACMACVDLKCFVIPDVHVGLLIVLALWRPIGLGWTSVAAGAAVGAGLLLAVRWVFARVRNVEALGLGDVKLIGALGALVGPRSILWVIVATSAIGVAWGLILNKGRIDRAQPAPFGAFAAIPAAVVGALAILLP